MGCKILYFELQMLSVMKCSKCRVNNPLTNTCIFQVSIKAFQDLENFYFKFQYFPDFSASIQTL